MKMSGWAMQPMDLCQRWNDFGQKGFVFELCDGKEKEFAHLVGRDNYTLTLTDTVGQQAKLINMDLYGLPEDYKYGNGDFVPEKTRCELRPAYEIPKFKGINQLRVGDWGEIYCTLYTAEDLIYYDYVDQNDIIVNFDSSDTTK